jgi:hypothetical protein
LEAILPMPYVMYLNYPTAQTAWVIVTPCVALWNHIAITKHAMKYGVMSIINVAGTNKQMHCAHDAWGFNDCRPNHNGTHDQIRVLHLFFLVNSCYFLNNQPCPSLGPMVPQG